ncbi:MAG TPA: hypothetical protein VN541_16440 [Tepidisphaeraceae bacterium]|nr:hypothetical protein [Tepidisphaeraceae bacterium]
MKEHLLELLNRDPFVPFRMSPTSGEGHEVWDPNLVALGESLLHVFFPRSDRSVTVRLNQIVSVELLEPAK